MGWHSISDNSVFEGGADYSRIKASSASQRVIKAIVLLSDGLQSMWGWRHKDSGGTGFFWYIGGEYKRSINNAEKNLADLCTNAKAKGVLVFTLGFALDDTDTLSLLEDCASPHPHNSEKTFYDARSANELDAAFDHIGSLLIGELHLSQ